MNQWGKLRIVSITLEAIDILEDNDSAWNTVVGDFLIKLNIKCELYRGRSPDLDDRFLESL